MKWRKKPVVIDAIQWDGKNLREVIDFTGLHPSANKWTWEEYEKVVETDGLKIFTLEGKMSANIGDWIIKGVHGEFYPCKNEIFLKTYESIPDLEKSIEYAKRMPDFKQDFNDASLPSSSVTGEEDEQGESEAIAVIEFLLDVNANGLKGDRFHKIEMCDGDFYWETDKDGDQPMDGKDIYNIYKQLNK